MNAFLALAHMLNATQWFGGDDNVPCNAGLMITFLALAHMLNATQLVCGGGDDNVP